MNILITGANGQLGRTLMILSVEYGHKFIFTSRTAAPGVTALDINDAAAIEATLKDENIDVIINCAAYTDVAGAETDIRSAEMTNAHAPAVLARAAKETGATIIHISTDYVFDGTSGRPYVESDAPNPLGIYAKTKLDGERAVIESGAKYLIFRTSWLYSVYGKNFFKTIADRAATMSRVKVVNDQSGTPTYAPDFARAILQIIDGGMLDMNGLYHYSDEGECSWFDFADAICRGLGRSCEVLPCSTAEYPSPVKRPEYSVLDKSRFKKTFGIEIPDWKDSLTRCITEYQK